MADIVETIRGKGPICETAADEIERLRDVKRITAILREHIPRYLDFGSQSVAFKMLDLSELAELIVASEQQGDGK